MKEKRKNERYKDETTRETEERMERKEGQWVRGMNDLPCSAIWFGGLSLSLSLSFFLSYSVY
jgi:hypothetical protein